MQKKKLLHCHEDLQPSLLASKLRVVIFGSGLLVEKRPFAFREPLVFSLCPNRLFPHSDLKTHKHKAREEVAQPLWSEHPPTTVEKTTPQRSRQDTSTYKEAEETREGG